MIKTFFTNLQTPMKQEIAKPEICAQKIPLPAQKMEFSSELTAENYDGNFFKKFLRTFGILNKKLSKLAKENQENPTDKNASELKILEIEFGQQLKTYQMLEGVNQVIISAYQESFQTSGNISANLFDTVDYFESPKSIVKIIKKDEQVIGYFLAKTVETKLKTEVVELAGFLLSKFQKMGIGTKTLRELIKSFPNYRYFVATTSNLSFIKVVDNLLTRISPEVDQNNRIFIQSELGLEVTPKDLELKLEELSAEKLELIKKLDWVSKPEEIISPQATIREFFGDFYTSEKTLVKGKPK